MTISFWGLEPRMSPCVRQCAIGASPGNLSRFFALCLAQMVRLAGERQGGTAFAVAIADLSRRGGWVMLRDSLRLTPWA